MKWIEHFLTVISWIAVLLLWGCAATVYIDPSRWGSYWSIVGLGFPFFVSAVVTAGLVSLVLRPRVAWISAVGLLGCCGSLRDYCPVNLSSPPPKGCLKVLTYNTHCLNTWEKDEEGRLTVLEYVLAKDPDVACLQEVMTRNEDDIRLIRETVEKRGYHISYFQLTGNRLAVISRWPAARIEGICRSSGNGAAAFYLPRGRKDTLVVVNVHLESMHLSPTERTNYSSLVHNPEDAYAQREKLSFVSKIAKASHERAHQADTLAQFLDRHAGERILLMGDFNDTPISYAHHAVCSRLTDVFRATGNGIGRSFNKDAMFVRIDHLFCSDHWKPFAAMVDDAAKHSDHYPLSVYLKPNP